jgi:glycosyltransferase A (GT-A) superfamily protein (DUF2064 family)
MTAIAVFVKTPGHSPVKSRLAAGIGRELAEQWHLHAARTVAAVAVAAGVGPVYWAVAEAAAATDPQWSDQPVLIQRPGGLGRRMAGIHGTLVRRHGSGLLLGADAPQWPATWLREAADWLRDDFPRLCLGPAHDGGFWTFGANRILPDADWAAVDYSRATTGAEFRQRMNPHGQWLELPSLTDLDELDDLPALIREFERLEAPVKEQSALRQWIERLRPLS